MPYDLPSLRETLNRQESATGKYFQQLYHATYPERTATLPISTPPIQHELIGDLEGLDMDITISILYLTWKPYAPELAANYRSHLTLLRRRHWIKIYIKDDNVEITRETITGNIHHYERYRLALADTDLFDASWSIFRSYYEWWHWRPCLPVEYEKLD